MSDTSVYNLARRARKNLRATALCQEPDLRRVVGHANMLDGLIAELLDLGYDWNDDVSGEQMATVTGRPFNPSGHVQWAADQATSDTAANRLRYSNKIEPSGDFNDLEDSIVSVQSDNSDSGDPDNADDWDDSDSDTSSESDELDQSDFYDSCDATVVETFEEYGNRNTCYNKYVLIMKAQTCSTPSHDISVLVSIREIE